MSAILSHSERAIIEVMMKKKHLRRQTWTLGQVHEGHTKTFGFSPPRKDINNTLQLLVTKGLISKDENVSPTLYRYVPY